MRRKHEAAMNYHFSTYRHQKTLNVKKKKEMVHPSKRKWIKMDRNEFVLFVSNSDSDLLNPFLSN